MLDEDPHLSDQDLLLAADGELPERRASQVREHLAACWECRARMSGLETTIAEFVREYASGIDSQLPPIAGPRAALRTQLAQYAAPALRVAWWRRPGPALVCMCGILVSVSAGATWLLEQRAIISRNSRRVFAELSAPKTNLTPGAVRPVSREEVCGQSRVSEGPRIVPASVTRRVLEEYGIPDAAPGNFEVDYLITPELGGSDNIRNLWPEPYAEIMWNARVKDELENRLHDMVCDGTLELTTAQHDISSDWISAYKKYFHTDRPLAPSSH